MKSSRDNLLKIILIILGLFLIMDTLVLFLVGSSFNLWNFLPSGMGIGLLLIAFLRERIKTSLITNPKIKKATAVIFTIWLISFIALEYLIIVNASTSSHQKADYLIILGAGLRGEQVSPTLRERLDKGIAYLQEYPDINVIVSGGKGFGEHISEAEAMRRYLLNKGIKDERIIKEEKSTSTMENFKLSKQLLAKQGREDASLMIITNDFHILRAKMLAQRNGFKAYGIPSKTPYTVILTTYIREYFALIKSYLFDWP